MDILILGGTGAMGMSLAPILAERGHNITVTSRTKHENKQNIVYRCGNPHEDDFLNELLSSHWDAIIDFMSYEAEEFSKRVERLLSATDQYIFLSSSRVYAESKTPLKEDSVRLLARPPSPDYLQTKEYALEKAREENYLRCSSRKNWTIIRPYITYNSNRLQLGTFEKENWLFRALEGRSIVFPRDIAEKTTTMTYGGDVAAVLAEMIGNPSALGECVHIATEEAMRWQEIMDIYGEVLAKEANIHPRVVYLKSPEKISRYAGNYAQIYYDRLYNRTFSNEKVIKLCGREHTFIEVREGLRKCLTEFLQSQNLQDKRYRNWALEAYMDAVAHEKWKLQRIPGIKKKIKYCLYRVIATIKRVDRDVECVEIKSFE